MVKFPASSKLPGGPKPRTEPFGPPPGVLCQSIGWSGRVSDEQWTRKIAAARTTVARMRVMRGPWKGLRDALKGRRRAACVQYPLPPPPLLPGGGAVTLTNAVIAELAESARVQFAAEFMVGRN